MINRVTHTTIQRSTLANLQANLARMAELQNRMSGSTMITKASDDPAGTVEAMRLRGDKAATAQHSRNAQDGAGWLSTVDTALASGLDALRSARTLTVSGSNSGALSDSARAAIAADIEAARDDLLAAANTTYNGRSVFAGNSSTTAFGFDAATGTTTYSGSSSTTVDRRIASATTVRVDSDGGAVFGTGDDPDGENYSVLALLTEIATKLRDGEDVSGYLDTIDARMEVLLGEVASVGARHKQVLAAQDTIASRQVTLTEQLSSIEDVDLAAIYLEIQMQEVTYQGALAAAAKVLQPSLMDFLR